MSECLLFDCDGTLVDSERLCNVGLVKKFAELGIALDADELVMRFRGWKLATVLDCLRLEFALELPDDFVPSYRAEVSRLFEAELQPVAGIEQALAALPQPKAVVSNGPAHKIRQALRICGLAGYFGERVYSGYDVGSWKPDPGLYQHAARHMGFAASKCAVIDDGPVGVEAGCLAGMPTYFYNRYDEPCDFPGVVSFQSMRVLPSLLNADQ